MCKFLTWEGWRASRVNVEGRLIDKETRTESGAVFHDKKFIKSSTTKGYSDVDATIKGRSCKFEAKGHGDKPREAQLKFQELERKAGGIYEFVYDPEQFYEFYDRIIQPELFL